jgi:hypothetical protein
MNINGILDPHLLFTSHKQRLTRIREYAGALENLVLVIA